MPRAQVPLGQSHKELTYADIAAALHISTDQVWPRPTSVEPQRCPTEFPVDSPGSGAVLHVLRLPDAFQVELWVMKAITSGLLTAKIEQVRELVIVTVCIEREFGDRQWERLNNNLGEGGEVGGVSVAICTGLAAYCHSVIWTRRIRSACGMRQ